MKKIIVLLILVLSCFACKTKEPVKTNKVNKVTRKPRVYKPQKEEKTNWIAAFNAKEDKLEEFYYKNTDFYLNGYFISSENKNDYFIKLKKMKNEIEGNTILETNQYEKVKIIEKGIYKASGNDLFYVTIWEKIRRKWYITYELIEEIKVPNIEKKNLEESRNRYSDFGNTDDITNFVYRLFDENGAYFHQNEYIIKSENVAKRFEEDMANSSKFDMKFYSKKQIAVSDNYIVDYGEYTVNSDIGNFFFIWKRQEDNYWKVYLDLCVF